MTTVPFCVAAARVSSRIPGFLTVRIGQSVELQCNGAGPPAPEVYWTKGSVRLSTNGTGTLRIDNATQQDSGDYSCHAVNYLGRQTKKTNLGIHVIQYSMHSAEQS